MYNSLREYSEFLIGIGKRYCDYADVEESLRLTCNQQLTMTGFMIQEDLAASKKLRIPLHMMPEALFKISLYLIDEEKNLVELLEFIKTEAKDYYTAHCQSYLDAIWREKNEK